jgi:hypothetical protein
MHGVWRAASDGVKPWPVPFSKMLNMSKLLENTNYNYPHQWSQTQRFKLFASLGSLAPGLRCSKALLHLKSFIKASLLCI